MPTLSSVAALGVLLAGAPLLPGIITRTKAVGVGRRGPPVWQLYADLWKLLQRGTVYSTTTTWAFRLAPVLLVVTTAAAAVLLPLDGRAPLIGFAGDAFAFVYLLALGRFVLVLAALDTGSSFEGMGASRDAAFACLAEVGLLIGLTGLAVAARSFSLGAMLAGPAARAAFGPASVVMAGSLFVIALAECSRVPVDDPATHLELTMVHEVMLLDHSGPDLAFMLYSAALKLALFAAIVMAVLLPSAAQNGWIGVGLLVVAFVLFGVGIGIVESAIARLRMPKVPLFLTSGAALALLGLILKLRA